MGAHSLLLTLVLLAHAGALPRHFASNCTAVVDGPSPHHVQREVALACPCMRHSSHKVMMVTSTGLKGLHGTTRDERRGLLSLANFSTPLWLFQERSLESREFRDDSATAELLYVLQQRLQKRLCLLDLFRVVPWLARLILAPDSCIDAFYRIAGRREPFEEQLKIKSAKLLVRKVAAMFATSLALPPGGLFMWIDVDIDQVAELDQRFISFVSAYDVTYIPFVVCFPWNSHSCVLEAASTKNYGHVFDSNDPAWRVESGLLAMRVNVRTVALLRALLHHYDGGAAALALDCLCDSRRAAGTTVASARVPCGERYFSRNLYLDDLFAWSLFMHIPTVGSGGAAALAGGAAPTWLPHYPAGLLQAWFAAGTPAGCVPDECKEATKQRLLTAWMGADHTQHHYKTGQGDPPGICACPGASRQVSPFNVYEYVVHNLGTGPYSQQFSVLSARVTEIPPELAFTDEDVPMRTKCRRAIANDDESAHLYLHQEIEAGCARNGCTGHGGSGRGSGHSRAHNSSSS